MSKCVHGQTQNANESINQIIWSKCPKTVFIEKQTFALGVYSAIIHFNEGAFGMENVFNHVRVEWSSYGILIEAL